MAPSALTKRCALLAPLALAGSAGAFDLDPCEGKTSYASGACPEGAVVACWSGSASWACYAEADAPAWAERALTADAACRAHPTPPGSATSYYDGACTLVEPTAPQAPLPRLVLMSWDEANAKANETLALMELAEKHALMLGSGWIKPPDNWFELRKWYYVGNTEAIPRLNIPSLNMQDAAGGFRTYWEELTGTVTCWPSLLAMAATWDPVAVGEFASAMGSEFAGKGANGILGPSVNVHRVARNGRNFEYLSGEDPYLGSRLAEAYLDGVHSQGLLSVAKHWIFNDQETNRGSQSSNVDSKTAWELYYPPFESSVQAGVSAVMCSYNRIDGVFSCSNKQQLDILKKKMGFQGFVQSDWWASHDTSVEQGLDQEMPGLGLETYFTPDRLSQQGLEHIDESTKRILAVVHKMNLSSSSKCIPPNCEAFFRANVTGPDHVALARTLAAESAVLLKNDKGVLPLSPSKVKTIAVLGAPAVAQPYNPNGVGQGQGGPWWQGDYYAGGGSGHVAAGHVVTPLEGIEKRAAAAGITVLASPTDDVGAAVLAAKQADVVIVVAATTSGESMDRPDLRLDGAADDLVRAVTQWSEAATVVIVQAPGAFVMPWRNSVDAILTMFLGGEQTGAAWADVLFGDHAPTGRLPIMLPATEADTIAPSIHDDVPYSEGLATSYRNPKFTAAFPFGHGLTYTTFEYSSPSGAQCTSGAQTCAFCVTVDVQNSGEVAGRTVAQLYIDFPPEAGQPAPILKGFQKSGVLLPNATETVSFCLTDRDLSYYEPATGGWVRVAGATALFGESSKDIRQFLSFTLGASEPSDSSYLYP